MPFLTREELLGRWKRRETVISLNGTEIPIREISVRDRIDAEAAGKPDKETKIFASPAWYSATIVQRSVLDTPGGELLFMPDDIPQLVQARGYDWQKNEMEYLAQEISTFSEVGVESFQADSDELHPSGDAADDDSVAVASESGSAG